MVTKYIPEIERKKFIGAVVLSDYKIRCRFIEKRIKNKFTRDEVSFLMGRNPYLIVRYEEMAGGVSPAPTDISILSAIFEEDMSFILEVDETDKDRRGIFGIQAPFKGKIEYEMNHNWTEGVDDRPFSILEKPLNEVLPKEERLIPKAIKEVDKLLGAGYFNKAKCALEIYRYVQREVSRNIRPLLLKKAVYYHLQEKQLVSFRNEFGQFRYVRNHSS